MQTVLALDLGTSSIRAALFDNQARIIPGSLAQLHGTPTTAPDGKAELDPADVLHRTQKCLNHALSKARRNPPATIGFSCLWHSLLAVDPSGNPLTPIYTWADSRCKNFAAKLRSHHDEKTYHHLTGCMFHSSFWPAKLLWLNSTTKIPKKLTRWVSVAEFIQQKLTGSATCSLSMASGTGLLDRHTLSWSPEALKLASLPPYLLNPISDTPSDLQGIPWFPAIGDGAASNLGSGATCPGWAAINFGTSAAIRIALHQTPPSIPFGLFCYRIDSHRSLLGGATSNAGNLHAWCLANLALPHSPNQIENILASRLEPLHNLLVLPSWNAERAPDWNENSTGTIHGLTPATSAADILQAISEATLYRIAKIANLLGPTRKIILSGGILKSPSATQRLADVLGRPVTPCREPEASLRGAAVFAWQCLGHQPPPPEFQPPVKPVARRTRLHNQKRAAAESLAAQLTAPALKADK